MENLVGFICISWAIIAISQALRAQAKARKEAELLERNPEAWKKVKEIELETKDRNRRIASGAAFSILKFLLKK